MRLSEHLSPSPVRCGDEMVPLSSTQAPIALSSRPFTNCNYLLCCIARKTQSQSFLFEGDDLTVLPVHDFLLQFCVFCAFLSICRTACLALCRRSVYAFWGEMPYLGCLRQPPQLKPDALVVGMARVEFDGLSVGRLRCLGANILF